MRIQVLGALRVWVGDGEVELGSGRHRVVLGLLALAGGRAVSRQELISGLWERPPASAANVVQTYVKRIRRLLEPERAAWGPSSAIRTVDGGYALNVHDIDLDLVRFQQLIGSVEDEGEGALIDRLSKAIGLWTGPAVADIAALAGHPRVLAITRQRQDAVLRYARAMIATGSAGEVLGLLEDLAEEHPLDEAVLEALVRASHAAGRRERAVAVYHEGRRRLADELGLDPGPALTAAYLALLAPGDDAQAGPAPAGRPAQLPADSVPFTGRAAELDQLDSLLAAGRAAPTSVGVVVLDGMAGIGKTTLAVHWAHLVAGDFPDGQLFVNLRGFGPTATAMPATEALRGFLTAFAVPAHRIQADERSQVDLYRSVLAGKRVLVVLDNARDPDQVRPLLPTAPGSLAVVTSRNRLSGLVAVDGARPLTLGLPAAEDALRLLANRIGANRVRDEPDAAAALVERCGRLPLAIAITAARVLARPAVPLATIAGELAGRLDAFADSDAAADVRATLAWSYRALDPAAARLFRLLGLPSGDDIGLAAATALAETSAARAAELLAELSRLHLVAEPAPGRYRMHDLLRAFAAELLTIEERVPAHGRLLDHYVHTAHAAALAIEPRRDSIALPLGSPLAPATPIHTSAHAWAWFAAERPVLLAELTRAAGAGFDRQAWQLGWGLFHFLLRDGHWSDLLASQELGLAVATRLGNRSAQAHAHRRLFPPLAQLGRFDEADEHLRTALALYSELGDDVNRAHTLTDINRSLGLRERYAEALPLALAAADLFEASGHPVGQAVALNLAAWDLTGLGRHAESLRYGRRTLDLLQDGGDRHTLAAACDTVGFAHHSQGEHRAAIAWYERALALFQALGDRFPASVTLVHLGEAYAAEHDRPAARAAWRQALDILDGLGHPDAEQVRARLAE